MSEPTDDTPRATLDAPGVTLDIDGVPRGQAVVDGLVTLLDLERLEDNLYRGVSPAMSPIRVFGGQVAAQALIAAGRTVPSEPVSYTHLTLPTKA